MKLTPFELIQELGLHMDATFIPRSRTDNAAERDMNKWQIHWRVRVYREKRLADIITDYSEGIARLPKGITHPGLQTSIANYEAVKRVLETGKYGNFNVGHYLTPHKLPPPSLTDVLYCLVLDGGAIDSPTFEDWAENYGFDVDSRNAERTYRACLETGLKLLAMLGSADLERLREAYQDY